MPRLSFLLLCLFMPALAQSSTWIGNGGSILDTELRSTLAHLKQALRASDKHDDLCRCSLGFDQCALLRDLSTEKANYCADFIRKEKNRFLEILATEPAIVWSAERLRTENSRDFDAIAQPDQKLIIIDEARFAKMNAADRLQLMAHEYLHLLGYKDDGAQGPYADGRQLLDTIGAALAVVANREGALPFRESKVSRPFRNFFVWGVSGQRSVPEKLQRTALYGKGTEVGNGLGLSWFPRVTDQLGWTAGSYTYSHTEKGLVKSTLTQNTMMIGPEYRILPFESGNRFLDSIHISGTLALAYHHITYKIEDDYNSFQEKDSAWGAVASARLQIPLLWNFWLMAERAYVYGAFDDYQQFQQTNAGVSYGFQF